MNLAGYFFALSDEEATQLQTAASPEISQVVEPLFRHEAGNLAQSAAGGEISEYHLPAGMAACHRVAKEYPSTDWEKIVSLYDRMLQFDDSPIVALNRAVALAEVRGPQAGIEAVNAIPDLKSLESNYLFHAVMGYFELQLNHLPIAAAHFQRALQLAEMPPERKFLEKRLPSCE